MSFQKVGVRAAKAAEKEADAVISSLARAGDAAIETTLSGICEKLKTNTPLMYHISALLSNPEWSGVLEASIHGVTVAPDPNCGDKPEKKQPLRAALKKFSHLPRLSFCPSSSSPASTCPFYTHVRVCGCALVYVCACV